MELLLKAATISTYDIGDIVMVQDDEFPWGSCECLPDFIVVSIDGTKADNLHLLDSIKENEGTEQEVIIKKRKNYLNIDTDISVEDKDKMKELNWHVPKIDNSKIKQK